MYIKLKRDGRWGERMRKRKKRNKNRSGKDIEETECLDRDTGGEGQGERRFINHVKFQELD